MLYPWSQKEKLIPPNSKYGNKNNLNISTRGKAGTKTGTVANMEEESRLFSLDTSVSSACQDHYRGERQR